METRPATPDECKEYARRLIRQNSAQIDKARAAYRAKEVSLEYFGMIQSNYSGQNAGIRMMLRYMQDGELV